MHSVLSRKTFYICACCACCLPQTVGTTIDPDSRVMVDTSGKPISTEEITQKLKRMKGIEQVRTPGPAAEHPGCCFCS